MLSFDQSREDNKAEFVERLMQAGWSREDAEQEYEQQAESQEDYCL